MRWGHIGKRHIAKHWLVSAGQHSGNSYPKARCNFQIGRLRAVVSVGDFGMKTAGENAVKGVKKNILAHLSAGEYESIMLQLTDGKALTRSKRVVKGKNRHIGIITNGTAFIFREIREPK